MIFHVKKKLKHQAGKCVVIIFGLSWRFEFLNLSLKWQTYWNIENVATHLSKMIHYVAFKDLNHMKLEKFNLIEMHKFSHVVCEG